jgi:hypothetical protein
MELTYSISSGGTIYIWSETGNHILYVIENKAELKALLDVLTELNNDIL